jgi:hypothetical protein
MTLTRPIHAWLVAGLVVIGTAGPARATDWPQLQRDAARTGHSPDEVPPPYRARWLWFGDRGTLRNRLSEPDRPGWTNDLTAGPGRSYPLPPRVSFTLAGTMQPIVHRGRVLVASLEGKVFAIHEDDGTTAWEAELPGGCLATGVAAGDVVVFASVRGGVYGYHLADGRTLWSVATGRAITGAPCLIGDRVYVANHGGVVTAIEVETGRVLWQSPRLGAAVQGSLAATSNAVYAVAEDLKVYGLDAATGQIVASRQIHGQSFRLQWPVIHAGKLWVRTAPVWCVGSEYVNDPLLATATSLEDEEAKFLAWLEGQASFGPHSSKNDWKSFFALNLPDLSEPFTIPCGPSEGCGQPPNPPVVTAQGELLAWWPTRYPALIQRGGVFGTRYFMDLAGVDVATGRRKLLDAGAPAHVWPIETDNLYALTTGGRFCYWRQRFRGTYAFDLQARRHHQVQVEVRDRDGGVWNAPVMYLDRHQQALPRTPSPSTAGRVGATVANERLYLSESYGVVAIEHAGGKAP